MDTHIQQFNDTNVLKQENNQMSSTCCTDLDIIVTFEFPKTMSFLRAFFHFLCFCRSEEKKGRVFDCGGRTSTATLVLLQALANVSTALDVSDRCILG